MEFEMSMLWT